MIETKRKYQILIAEQGGFQFVDIEGEPIQIAGFEELELFVHRTYENTAWAVSEVSTGMSISSLALTPEMAVVFADEKLRLVGIEKAISTIKEYVDEECTRRGSVVAYTEREVEILRRIAQGQTLGEIEKALFISNATAKRNVRSIRGKLGAVSTPHAVYLACRRGILLPIAGVAGLYRDFLIGLRDEIDEKLNDPDGTVAKGMEELKRGESTIIGSFGKYVGEGKGSENAE